MIVDCALRPILCGDIDTAADFGSIIDLRRLHYELWHGQSRSAGLIRDVDVIADGQRCTPALYLDKALEAIDALPADTIADVATRIIELNFCRPFAGYWDATLIAYSDLAVRSVCGRYVDWGKIDTDSWHEAVTGTTANADALRRLLADAITSQKPELEFVDPKAPLSMVSEAPTEYGAVCEDVTDAEGQMVDQIVSELLNGSTVYIDSDTRRWVALMDCNAPDYLPELEPDRQQSLRQIEQWGGGCVVFLPSEIDYRLLMRQFASTIPPDTKASRLIDRALTSTEPIRAFDSFIERLNLRHDWHNFARQAIADMVTHRLGR